MATEQLYGLAEVMERFNGGVACVTYNQNVCLQNIHARDLEALYDALCALNLATPNVDSLSDMIAALAATTAASRTPGRLGSPSDSMSNLRTWMRCMTSVSCTST